MDGFLESGKVVTPIEEEIDLIKKDSQSKTQRSDQVSQNKALVDSNGIYVNSKSLSDPFSNSFVKKDSGSEIKEQR